MTLDIKQYFYDEILDFIKEKDSRADFNTEVSKIKKVIKFLIPESINKALIAFLKGNRKKNDYEVIWIEKRRSLEFLSFILNNPATINLEHFYKEDVKKLKRYIKNRLLTAIKDTIPMKDVFTNEILAKQKEFNQKIKSHLVHNKNFTEFMGFKSVTEEIGYDVILENNGIGYIPDNIKKRLKNTNFIDCGAFIGDSAFCLNKELNPSNIYCLEPELTNYNFLKKNLELMEIKNAYPINKGVWNKSGKLYINSQGPGSELCAKDLDDAIEIEVIKIDELVEKHKIDSIGLIKMDLEGAEMETIRGAEKTIRKFSPVLILAAYHKGEDLFKLPEKLLEYNNKYKFRFVDLFPFSSTSEHFLIAYID